MNTLLLDPKSWDLTLDASRNIAVTAPVYSLAQDAGSAIRLFLGECWYDTTRGLPYWADTLGHWPPLSLIRAHIERASLTVPGVTEAKCEILSYANRTVGARVFLNGGQAVVNL